MASRYVCPYSSVVLGVSVPIRERSWLWRTQVGCRSRLRPCWYGAHQSPGIASAGGSRTTDGCCWCCCAPRTCASPMPCPRGTQALRTSCFRSHPFRSRVFASSRPTDMKRHAQSGGPSGKPFVAASATATAAARRILRVKSEEKLLCALSDVGRLPIQCAVSQALSFFSDQWDNDGGEHHNGTVSRQLAVCGDQCYVHISCTCLHASHISVQRLVCCRPRSCRAAAAHY